MSSAESYVEQSNESIAKACGALAAAARLERLGMKKSSLLMREVASLGFRHASLVSALSMHPSDADRMISAIVEVRLMMKESDRLAAEFDRAMKEESK